MTTRVPNVLQMVNDVRLKIKTTIGIGIAKLISERVEQRQMDQNLGREKRCDCRIALQKFINR